MARRVIIDRGVPWYIPRAPTEAEICVPMAGLFLGGVIFAAAILHWVPDEAVNSLAVVGFFLQSFCGFWILINPAARKPRRRGF